MTDLLREKCVACRRDAPLVTDDELAALRQQVPDWRIEEQEAGIPRLVRVFRFPDFAGALAFTNRIGRIAEEADHHPAILTEWGRATVSWWTHTIKGLHRNDFIMAARTDSLASGAAEAGAPGGSQTQ